mmetsp:Transcript_5610/g.11559  ORF Transcript_5610/g.11559 Transcript_5610/m.11559 type:complete len:181 (+) Transcript_5610:27-569(+)
MQCSFATTVAWLWSLFFAVLAVRNDGAAATPPVQAPTNRNCPSTTPKTTTAATPQGLFGVSQRLPSLPTIRGGAVEEPVSPEDVDSLILKAGAEEKLVVIDFTASWCGPCKMIAPVFKELSETFSNVVFVKIDVDENPDTAAKYNVSAMPTFVFVKGGNVVDRLMGANPARLEELLQEYM